jgi:hypothetical protein
MNFLLDLLMEGKELWSGPAMARLPGMKIG